MIKYFYKRGADPEVANLKNFKANSWIYVEEPTEAEMKKLVSEMGLDESLLSDAVDIHEVPRVEVEDSVVYVYTRFVFSSEGKILTAPMLVAVAKNFVLTVSPKPFPRLSRFLEGKIAFSTVSKTKLSIYVLQQVTATYRNYLNSISKSLSALSVDVEKIRNRDIIQFVNFENVLYELNTTLIRIDTVYSTLLGGRLLSVKEEEKDLIEDLLLENGQLVQITQESLRSIVNIREGYSTIMTNNLNRVIKLFTSLTVILTIPTIVASIFGMNVSLPLAQSPAAFSVIMLVTLFLVLVTIVIFSFKDWL